MGHDLFSHLLNDQITNPDASGTTNQNLIHDCELAVVAGSDSSASVLSGILSLLATHPDKLATLQEELDALRTDELPLLHASLANATYLDGCIQAALRLCPAIMSGSQREIGPRGAVVAGRFIPPHMLVSTPTYVLHRGETSLPTGWSFVLTIAYLSRREKFCEAG